MPASGPISEGQRLALLNRLCELLGEQEGRTLMESLPAVHWHDLATKEDIKNTNEAIEASEERLRTEMHAGFANIRTDMNAEFIKVYAELHSLRAETASEFKLLRAENKEFQGAITLQLARQTRTMVFTMLGLAMPTWGAILAVGPWLMYVKLGNPPYGII